MNRLGRQNDEVNPATVVQQAPTAGRGSPVWALVEADLARMMLDGDMDVVRSQAAAEIVLREMGDRNAFGIAKYKMALRAFNGRRALVDLYQGLLDASVYNRQAIAECCHETPDDKARLAVLEIVYRDTLRSTLRVREEMER